MASCAVTEQLTVKDDEEEKKKKKSHARLLLPFENRQSVQRNTDFWRELDPWMIQTAEAVVCWSQLNCEPR